MPTKFHPYRHALYGRGPSTCPSLGTAGLPQQHFDHNHQPYTRIEVLRWRVYCHDVCLRRTPCEKMYGYRRGAALKKVGTGCVGTVNVTNFRAR
jgi:hypothetical protein